MSREESSVSMDVDASASIVISAAADLAVRGHDENRLVVKAEPGTFDVQRSDDGISVSARDDCIVRLPQGASLRLQSVGGDATVADVSGPLAIQTVGGDLMLRHVGATRIEAVSGDLDVRRVTDDLIVGTVGVDASVRDVDGSLVLRNVGVDLSARGVGGDITAKAGGDADVALQPAADRHYEIEAGADVDCRLPAEPNLTITARAGAGAPRIRLPDAPQPEEHDGQWHIVLGDGGATANLTAGRRLTLRSTALGEGSADVGVAFGEEFGRMAEEIARQVEAETTRLTVQLGDHLSRLTANLPDVLAAAGLGESDAERIAERTRQSMERAAEKARRRAEVAVQRMEAKLERTERRLERQVGRGGRHRVVLRQHGHGWAAAPEPPPPPREPVTEAERLAVLRILQEQRITAEEAERLLAALES
jgi:hypothetical protein